MTHRTLTDAERRVVRLLALGLTAAQIARRLHVTVHTVRQHLKRVSGRWNVHTGAGIVGQAYESGSILEPDHPRDTVARREAADAAVKEAADYKPLDPMAVLAGKAGRAPRWFPEFLGDRRKASRDRRHGVRNRRKRDDGEM